MNKRDAREQRKAEKLARFEKSKAALLERVSPPAGPKVAVNPTLDHDVRLAPHLAREKPMEPQVRVSGSRFSLQMTYCDTRMDTGEWSWKEWRGWSEPEMENLVHPAMKHLQALTWGEIDALNSGSGHKLHHSHEIGDLIPEAQQRWIDADLEQFDVVFRFRIGGQRCRAWGYVVQAHFHLVWADREHRLYPVG